MRKQVVYPKGYDPIAVAHAIAVLDGDHKTANRLARQLQTKDVPSLWDRLVRLIRRT